MNPRIKKIGRNILFLLSVPAIIGAFVFANSNKQNEFCSGIDIHIVNNELSFVTTDDISKIFENEDIRVDETLVSAIHIAQLEEAIRTNPWVKQVDIFVAADHSLKVQVAQKKAMVRIQLVDSSDHAYYLDEEANPLKLSEQYIAKVPVLTATSLNYSIEDMQLKREAVQLAEYIQNDSFWNAMVSQIHLNQKQEFELIPTLGEHLILLGRINDLDNKMKRLLLFYQQGMNTLDWTKYDEIDLRFDRQVVARNTKVAVLPSRVEEAKKEEKLLLEKNKPTTSVVVKNTKQTSSTSKH
ncbi:MAG: hypothetical protein IPI46_09095 [Bacteroidetes bacterium]|nr:hypothetical protein [Bacteroidota bacterium]